MATHTNNYPKLHNAAWPGLVGKGEGAEPPIDLDTMLDMTAAAEVDGLKFEGFDIFLYDPHFNIDGGDDEIKSLAEKAQARNLDVGTVVAPIYEGTGGGSPLDEGAGRTGFVGQVRKACHVAKTLREMGVRPNGNVRFDSGIDVASWSADPEVNMQKIADTFREACQVAEDHGEAWRGLGVAILHRLIVEHLLGYDEIAKPVHVNLAEEVARRLGSGDHPMAAMVMPATVEDIRAVSLTGERMPAKSTYFYPKLLSGLVFNPLQ